MNKTLESKSRILVVENEEVFVELIRSVLKDYNLTVASTAENAIKHIKDVDLVITDYDFPGGGFEAIKPHLLEHDKNYIIQSSAARKDSSKNLIAIIGKHEVVHKLPKLVKDNI